MILNLIALSKKYGKSFMLMYDKHYIESYYKLKINYIKVNL